MVEGHLASASLLDSLPCHVDLGLVQAFVDFWAKSELLADRFEHGGPLVGLVFAVGTGLLLRVFSCRSDFSKPMQLLVDALLSQVDLVDGLGRGVVNLGPDGGLANADAVLVNELDEEAALLVGHGGVLFGHRL